MKYDVDVYAGEDFLHIKRFQINPNHDKEFKRVVGQSLKELINNKQLQDTRTTLAEIEDVLHLDMHHYIGDDDNRMEDITTAHAMIKELLQYAVENTDKGAIWKIL